MGTMPGDRGRDARLAELQRAAFRRDATAEDRAALTAFERGRRGIDPPPLVTDRPRGRRFGWAVTATILIAAGCVAAPIVAASGLFGGDAFERFTAPVEDPYAVADVLARLALTSAIPGMAYVDSDTGVGAITAGPVPLHSSHGVDLFAALVAPTAGEQMVCLVQVRDVFADLICVTRAEFEDEGITHRFARDDELNAVVELVWRADDTVSIRKADLSGPGR